MLFSSLEDVFFFFVSSYQTRLSRVDAASSQAYCLFNKTTPAPQDSLRHKMGLE